MNNTSLHNRWSRFAAMAGALLFLCTVPAHAAGLSPAPVTTTGSSVTTEVLPDQSTLVTFLADGTLTVPAGATGRALFVGGGGGGGSGVGGGGGGGGVVVLDSLTLAAGTYTVTVGAGGAGGPNNGVAASDGGDSTMEFSGGGAVSGLLPALGGGHGGCWYIRDPGSRGTGGASCGGTGPGSGTPGQGYAGGTSGGRSSGGGGGAGGPGGNGGTEGNGVQKLPSAVGGVGVTNDITGVAIAYGGGGGGGGGDSGACPGSPGTDGGGDGTDMNGGNAGNGEDGRGGGGGGSGWGGASTGGNGGSGVVILRLDPVAVSSTPQVVVSGVVDGDRSAVVTVYLASVGDGGTSATVSYVFATSVAGLATATTNVAATGVAAETTVPISLTGLQGGKTYYVRVFAENDQGDAATPVDATAHPIAGFDPASFDLFAPFAVTGYAGTDPLTNFPVLVRLSAGSPAGFVYADCAADGSDLRFADPAGNLIPHEIDTWDPAGESLLWVRVPVATNGAAFKMYYASSVPGIPSSENVWARYAAVIHGGSSIENAIADGPAVTVGNTTYVKPDAGAGKVGGGIRKSTGNAIAVNVAMGTTTASTTLDNTGKFSVSGWFKRNGNGGGNNGTHVLAGSRPQWDNGEGFLWLQEKGQYISIAARGGNGGHQWQSGSHTLADQTWAHVSFAYESGVSLTSWFNGEQDNRKASPGNLVSSGGTWTFGSYANTGSNDSFVGDMDELRVFDGVASGDWMKAEHDAVANASFLAAGEVQVTDPDAPRIAAPAVVEGICRLDVSFACANDGATVTYRLAAPGEDPDEATPVVVTSSSTADAPLAIPLAGLVGDTVYTIVLEAEKDGHAARPITIVASPFGADAAFTPSPAANDVRTRAGGDEVHVLSASGTFTLATRRRVRLLAVGGGGGSGWGSNEGGAGGGAGGMLEVSNVVLRAGTYRYEIGAGGAPGKADAERGGNGGDTVLYWTNPDTGVETELYRAVGGGGSGCHNTRSGIAGGSGGGAVYRSDSEWGNPGVGTAGQGHDGGGWTVKPATTVGSSGGGGAGAPGETGTATKGGDGGDGRPSDITGAEVWYAGGGGGSARNNNASVRTPGKGGRGGGGDGSDYGYWDPEPGRDGVDGLGGGGGGGLAWYIQNGPSRWHNCFGGRGGSGTLILRYESAAEPAPVLASATAEVTDRTVATFSGTVKWEGEGASGADLVLALDGVSETVATGLKQGDAFSVEKTVARGATVAWSAKLVNSLGAESAAVSGSLSVPADAPVAIAATGATRVFDIGADTVAVFENTASAGTLVVPEDAWVEILVVGGGGAGGRARSGRAGGGGGAGGFVYNPAQRLAAGTYSIVVGAGGSGREDGEKQSYNWPGQNGGDSAVQRAGADVPGLRAYGGSGGGGSNAGNWTNVVAVSGSTGGVSMNNTQNYGYVPVPAKTPTAGQGNRGGTGAKASDGGIFPGGGGGAGAPGADADPDGRVPGDGGDGLPCSITGEEVWYAGGGGGGAQRARESIGGVPGNGGLGGGGNGQRYKKETSDDCRGVNGLGGGGGGGAYYNDDDNLDSSCTGHSGGSGVVVVRWRRVAADAIVVAPDEPVGGFRRGTFSGTATSAGGEDETLTVEIGVSVAGSAATNWTTIATGLAAGGTFAAAIDGLADNRTYVAAWRATNGAGATATGAAGSFSTTAAGGYLVPAGASDGMTVTTVGNESIYTYSNSAAAGTFVVAQPGYARVLVVGGGGAGGYYIGGGGGGGGVIEEELVWFDAGTYGISVGAGGAPSVNENSPGGNGGDTVVSFGAAERWRALGGGGGGSWKEAASSLGGSGGSGGGSSYRRSTPGKTLDPAQGNDGAPGHSLESNWNWWAPGGGGGAGSPGQPASSDHTVAGAGGAGRTFDISGSPQMYGAGGGAAGTQYDRSLSGPGGDGIGGHGRRQNENYLHGDEAGRAGYGGGGGGGAPKGSNNQDSFNRNPGAPGGCGTVVIRFASSAPAGGLPDAAVVEAAPSASDPTAARVEIFVRSLGGAASATLELAYGATRGSLPLRFAVGTVTETGTVEAELPGLEPGTTYYVAAAIRNASGETVTRAMEVSIPAAGAAGDGLSGLWQARWMLSAVDRDPNIWDSVATKGVVSGAIAAFGKGDAVDPVTGDTYAWGGVGTMFLYKGFMFLKGGTTYTFGARMDDSVYVALGGEELIDTQSSPATDAFGEFTAPWTGWYPIDVRLGNGIGDAHGPDGDGLTSWNNFALAFNTEGSRAMIPDSAWTTLVDPGDGSLLRPEMPAARYADVAVGTIAGGSLTLSASVAPGNTAVHAYLCYGAAWAGTPAGLEGLAPLEVLAALENLGWTAADLGEVAAAGAATSLGEVQVPNWGTSAKVAAVALVHPDGTVTWSDPATYAGTSLLSLSAAATDWSQGDQLEATFSVSGGSAPYRAELWVGNGPGSLSKAATATGLAAGTHVLRATDLVPGLTYYWQVVVTDAAGVSASSDASANVKMPAGAVYLDEALGISWSLDQRTATLNGGVKTLGAGDNWGLLQLYEDPYLRWENTRNYRGNATNSGDRVRLEGTGGFTIVRDFPWESQIGFAWIVSNSNGRTSWNTLLMPNYNGNEAADRGTFWVGDRETYTWNGGTGDYDDETMWTPDPEMDGHDRRGFPITGSYFTFPAGSNVVHIPAAGSKTENGVPVYRPVSFDVPAGAKVRLEATAQSARFNLVAINPPNRTRAVNFGSGGELVISGVKGVWKPRNGNESTFYFNAPDTLLEFTDGAELEIGHNVGQWVINSWNDGTKTGRRFVFSKGAKVTFNGQILISGPQEFVIDDAQVVMGVRSDGADYNRVHIALTDGGRFVFRGANPLLRANNRINVEKGTNPRGAELQFFDFEVPAGGFAGTPLQTREGNTYQFGDDGGTTYRLVLRVPADAPAATAKGVLDQPIVWWPAGKTDSVVIDRAYLPHPDTDDWYETFDPVTGAFTGWGVRLVGRPDIEEPQVVGLAMTNIVDGAADFEFYGIPGTNAVSATFAVSIERTDAAGTPAVALSPNGTVSAGTRFGIAATGLVRGGSYRITVTGVDSTDGTLTCTETLEFDALRDYAAATTGADAVVTQDGPYTVWTFTNSAAASTFTVTRPGTARVLVVGGGGSGGGGDSTDTNYGNSRRGGGGGGGGEVVEGELYLTPGDYVVTVGAGGAAVGANTLGKAGGTSSFDARVTALGGGGGGGNWNNNGTWDRKGANGASGGGAAGGGAGGAATAAGGHAGGAATYTGWANWNDLFPGGGGGAMGGVGGASGLDALDMLCGGAGADGVPSDITGSVVYYGGGGGGGCGGLRFGPGNGGFGGRGGGGEGRAFLAATAFVRNASQGADGFGGGGGGGSSGALSGADSALQAYRGGKGGDGVVIVRMLTSTLETADPAISVRSVEPSTGGLAIDAKVHSLGAGAASADLLLAFDLAADYDAAAGFSRTNALGSVAATGAVARAVAGLKPGTAYVGALVATNAIGGVAAVDLGTFSTAAESHADADSGVVAGTWSVAGWAENDPSFFADNLLRASRGTTVRLYQNRKKAGWGPTSEQSGGNESDVIDGLLNRTSGRNFGLGTNTMLVFTLAEKSAVSSMRFFTGWGVGAAASPIAVMGIDVRSDGNEEWRNVAGSAFRGPATTTWGTIVDFAAGGNDWLARDVRQIRVRFDRNVHQDGTMYWEIEAQGAPESEAPAVDSRAGRGRPLAVASSIRTANAFSGVVTAAAGAPAFDAVCAVWGPTYAGEDTNAWANVRAIGSAGEAATSLALSLSGAELDDAVYVRYVGYGADGTVSWSDSVYVPELAVQADVPPVVVLGSAVSGGAYADIEATVVSAGSLAVQQAVDVELQYTVDPDGFAEGASYSTFAFANGAAVGALPAVRVAPLQAARRYFARFVAENDGHQVGTSEVFSFDTAAGVSDEGSGDWGLQQQSVTGLSNGATLAAIRAAAWDDAAAEPVEGAIMAYTTGSKQSAKTGANYSWGSNAGYIYKGVMHMRGSVEYNFAGRIDDAVELRIDGNLILSMENYGGASTGTFTPPQTGWYEIEARMSNGGGGAGYGFGLAWSDDGSTTFDANHMSAFVDPGDGSLLRTGAARAVAVTKAQAVAGGVDLGVTLSDGRPSAGAVYAVWGPSDLGTDVAPAGWPGCETLVASTTDAAAEFTGIVPFDPVANPVLRAVFVPQDAALEKVWSTPVVLDAANPTIGPATAETDGDRMTVAGTMSSLGTGTGFSLDLLWGYEADLSDAQTNAVAVASDGSFTATVATVPGTNGWWRLVARTSDGGVDATLPTAFETAGGSVLKGLATATVAHHTMTASGTLDVLGAGDTTVTVWAGSSENDLAPVATSSKPLAATGPFTIQATFPGAPQTVYWKLVTDNVAPGGSTWTSETPVYSLDTVDQATYTWKTDVPAGDWNDPACWTVSGISDPGDCIGYPNHAKASVVFQNGTAATIAVPAGEFKFDHVALNVNSLDVTLVGEGAGVSVLNGNFWGGDDNSVWNGWRVVFDNLTVTEYDNIRIGGPRTQNATLRLQNGAVYSLSGYQEFKGTNVWLEAVGGSTINWRNGDNDSAGLTLWVADGGLLLEDSTANPPDFNYERGKTCGDQQVVLKGESVFRIRRYGRPYSESEDPGNLGALTVQFWVPKDGWTAGADTPLYANYIRNNADNKKFAWRSAGKEIPVVFEVASKSPLLQTGRKRTVQLMEWNAGIDLKNATLRDSNGVHMYWTYGFPQVRTTPTSVDELPTGVAADIAGFGATILIVQ